VAAAGSQHVPSEVLAGAAEQGARVGVVRSDAAWEAGRPAETVGWGNADATPSEDLEENAVGEINSGNVGSIELPA
jgi:hypothetical protein